MSLKVRSKLEVLRTFKLNLARSLCCKTLHNYGLHWNILQLELPIGKNSPLKLRPLSMASSSYNAVRRYLKMFDDASP